VTVVIATIILLRINSKLTLLAYLPLALVSLTVKHFGQQIHDRFERIQDQFSMISNMAQETCPGHPRHNKRLRARSPRSGVRQLNGITSRGVFR